MSVRWTTSTAPPSSTFHRLPDRAHASSAVRHAVGPARGGLQPAGRNPAAAGAASICRSVRCSSCGAVPARRLASLRWSTFGCGDESAAGGRPRPPAAKKARYERPPAARSARDQRALRWPEGVDAVSAAFARVNWWASSPTAPARDFFTRCRACWCRLRRALRAGDAHGAQPHHYAQHGIGAPQTPRVFAD